MAILSEPTLPPPSRYRGRVGLTILLAALALGPIAWIAQLVIVYAVSSHACFPHSAPLLDSARIGFWWLLLVINLVGIALAAMAGLTSLRNYRVARNAAGGSEIATRVEGRTQFLAGWGGLAGLGFFAGGIADLIALVVVPPCLG